MIIDTMTDDDLDLLHRTVELATEALKTGNSPYGSLLIDSSGTVLFEDHNRDGSGDNTRHPEFEIARWAAENLSAKERAHATVYTSTEHCAMCAAAHAWVGLGKIICASTGAQVASWNKEWGAPASPIYSFPASEIGQNLEVVGPAPMFEEALYELHHWAFLGSKEA